MIQHKDDTAIKETIQDYEKIILAIIPLTLNELKNLIEELGSGQITLKSLGTINAKNGFHVGHQYISSRTHNSGYYYDWPCYCFRASLNSQEQFQGISGPVIKTGLPAYPSIFEACKVFFQHKETPTQHEPVRIDFLIPDYDARINQLDIEEKQISVSVEGKGLSLDDLVVQIFCKKSGNKHQHSEDLKFDGSGTVKLSADFVPDEVFVYLLNSQNNKKLDSKIFNPYYVTMTDGITVKTSVESLEAMLVNGEDQRTEFKYDLDKNYQEFLESVVSFANTNDGRILLGIDDDGKVIGFVEDFDKIDRKINNLVDGRCEPDITIRVEQIMLEGKSVIVVSVKEGTDKPYLLAGKSAYKRVDKDDRIFKRHDFDRILSKRRAARNMPSILDLPRENGV